jgi:ankyrin repeat protein
MREFQGSTANLGTVAAEVSDYAFEGLSREAKSTPDARRQVAENLLAEARGIGLPDRRVRPLSPAAQSQIGQVTTLIDAAAFFVPENGPLQELRAWLMVTGADDSKRLDEASAQYRRLALSLWKADGRFDLGIIQRSFEAWAEVSTDKITMVREVGEALKDARPEELVGWKNLFGEFFMNLWFKKEDPNAVAALDVIWPALQAAIPDEFGPEAEHPPMGWRNFIKDFYHGDLARARALLNRVPPTGPAAGAPGGRALKIVSSPSPEDLLSPGAGRGLPSHQNPIPTSPVRNTAPVPNVVSHPYVAPVLRFLPTRKPAAPASTGPVTVIGDGTKQLCDESGHGTLETFKALLAAGADPVRYGDPRSPALTLVAAVRQWDYVEAILDRHVNLSQPRGGNGTDKATSVGAYALYEALYYKRIDIARRLLDLGARPDGVPFMAEIQPFLAVALYAGDEDVIKRVISLGAVPKLNEHLLVRAVDYRCLAGLKLILPYQRGYQPTGYAFDPAYSESSQALIAAVRVKWKEGVQVLMDGGASPTAKDVDGSTVQDLASLDPEMSELLNRRSGSPDSQMEGARAVAAVIRKDPQLESLPLNDAILHYKDSRGWSVLHHACHEKASAFALRLVRAGAPLNILTNAGQSPLAFAVAAGDEELVASMLSAGADVNLKGTGEMAAVPLKFAAYHGNLNLVNLLLQAGADTKKRSSEAGTTPLLAACNHADCIPILKALVAAGASYQEVDIGGYGALEYAIFSDDPAVIQYLIDQGVSWRRPSDSDYNPFLQAVRNGKRESVSKLLALGMYDSRALTLAKDPTMKALIEDASRAKGNRVVDDEELWPSICKDLRDGAQRAQTHVSKGGNVNYRSETWTPLLLALKECNFSLVKWLLSHGANPHIWALEYGSFGYQELVANGPGVRFESKNPRDEDVAEIVALLVQAGAGEAAPYDVVMAAENGWPKTVKALMGSGVSKESVLNDFRRSDALTLTDQRRVEVERLLDQ